MGLLKTGNIVVDQGAGGIIVIGQRGVDGRPGVSPPQMITCRPRQAADHAQGQFDFRGHASGDVPWRGWRRGLLAAIRKSGA